jgi:hypothetical protein
LQDQKKKRYRAPLVQHDKLYTPINSRATRYRAPLVQHDILYRNFYAANKVLRATQTNNHKQLQMFSIFLQDQKKKRYCARLLQHDYWRYARGPGKEQSCWAGLTQSKGLGEKCSQSESGEGGGYTILVYFEFYCWGREGGAGGHNTVYCRRRRRRGRWWVYNLNF